jgi:hypothetical protein
MGSAVMGNRGPVDKEEYDAFDRQARRMVSWPRGHLRLIKRRYQKRMRVAAKLASACKARHYA